MVRLHPSDPDYPRIKRLTWELHMLSNSHMHWGMPDQPDAEQLAAIEDRRNELAQALAALTVRHLAWALGLA